MRNIVLAIALMFCFQPFCQTKPAQSKTPQTSSQTKPEEKIVKKALYTDKERAQARKNFAKDVEKIGMKPDVKKQYMAIIDKNAERLRASNKDRKLTKKQATDYVNKVMAEQDQAVKHILTVEQFKKHESITNRYQNSALYRIEKQ